MAVAINRADIDFAIKKYAPIIRLHPDEKYDMCSLEWFLSHSTLVDSKPPTSNIQHPVENQLPEGPKEGARYYFEIEDEVKPGNMATAKAYVNIFWDHSSTFTDFQFWLFFAYNGPGTAKFDGLLFNRVANTGNVDLAPLGEHVGDWEFATIRVDNASKEMTGIILSVHGKSVFYNTPAEIKANFQLQDGTHPIVYSSRNGHANFAKVGPNFTENRKVLGIPAGLQFNLLNTTADGGKSLDCSQNYEVVATNFLTGTEAISTPRSILYPYRWGPEGTAVQWNAKTLGDFIKAALGDKVPPLLIDNPVVLLASDLLQIFVRADINGAAAPMTQSPWIGHY